MSRPVTMFTGQWADLPLGGVGRTSARASATTGSNWPAGATTSRSIRPWPSRTTAPANANCWSKNDLKVLAISNHLVGQAVLDMIDARHKAILPPYVWGDGNPAGVNARAAEEMKNTARAAQKLGVSVVNGFTGSSIWHLLYSFPPVSPDMIDDGFKLLAERLNPILDVFGECGVKFALEVHPTEIAFDLYTAERALEALGLPRGVRLQLRSQPPDLAGRRSGGVHPRVPRSHLPRPHEGRDRHAQRPQRAFCPAT